MQLIEEKLVESGEQAILLSINWDRGENSTSTHEFEKDDTVRETLHFNYCNIPGYSKAHTGSAKTWFVRTVVEAVLVALDFHGTELVSCHTTFPPVLLDTAIVNFSPR